MPIIEIHTIINAPIQRYFDLARNVDVHQTSLAHTNERAVAGKTSGLVELGDTITWQAKHLGVTQLLSVKITAMKTPFYFVDEMTKGAFSSFLHEHIFEEQGNHTLMIDRFDFKAPLGLLGILANKLFLTRYMTNMLTQRNLVLKKLAEDSSYLG